MAVISAIAWPNDKVYVFEGDNTYRRFDGLSGASDGGPTSVTAGWPGLAGSPDAAVWWGCGKAYMFFGPNYVRYDVKSNTVEADYLPPNPPRTIAQFWPGVWTDGVDAAVNWGNGKIYFFKGGEYTRYDITLDRVDEGYPKSISLWPGLWTEGVHAAAHQGGAKAWFFRGNEYRRYDVAADAVDASGPFSSLHLDAVPSGVTTAARDLTPTQANRVMADLIRRGLLSLKSWTPFVDGPGGIVSPTPGQRVAVEPATVNGIRYTSMLNPTVDWFDNVDQRMLVALYRLTRWLNASDPDVTEILHKGIGHGGGPPNDCHNQGRALDFGGVAGTFGGSAFRKDVQSDWGNRPATGSAVRLDRAADRLAHDLFSTTFRFGTFEGEGNGIGPGNHWPPPDLGQSGFVIYPDYGGDAALRNAHQDHIHLQIGPTRV